MENEEAGILDGGIGVFLDGIELHALAGAKIAYFAG
jgi:hypothetical protein